MRPTLWKTRLPVPRQHLLEMTDNKNTSTQHYPEATRLWGPCWQRIHDWSRTFLVISPARRRLGWGERGTHLGHEM